MPTSGGYADPLTFAAIRLVIPAILSTILYFGVTGIFRMQYGGFRIMTIVWLLIVVPILGIIGIFIGAAILYFIYKTLGGTGTYEGTARFISYASAVQVLSWIPIVSSFIWVIGYISLLWVA